MYICLPGVYIFVYFFHIFEINNQLPQKSGQRKNNPSFLSLFQIIQIIIEISNLFWGINFSADPSIQGVLISISYLKCVNIRQRPHLAVLNGIKKIKL